MPDDLPKSKPNPPQFNLQPVKQSQPGQSPQSPDAITTKIARKVLQPLSLTRQLLLIWGAIALTALVVILLEPTNAETLTIAVLLVLPVAVLLWLRLFVIRPIRQVDRQLLNVSRGKSSQKMAIATSDEFSTLSSLVNQTSNTLDSERRAKQKLIKDSEQAATKLLNTQTALQESKTTLKETKTALKETRLSLQKDRTSLKEAWTSLKEVRLELKERNLEVKTLHDDLRLSRIRAIELEVQHAETTHHNADQPSVLFLDVSSHIYNLSFNGIAGLLATWGLRLAGQSVTYLVCHSGFEKCLLGTRPADLSAPMPCETCIANNTSWYPAKHSVAFHPPEAGYDHLSSKLMAMTTKELLDYRYGSINLGELCVPSVRWRLRRWNLDLDAAGHDILAIYIASAIALAQRLETLFSEKKVRSLLLFNGTFFPEATARAIAQLHNIPVVTYESGFQPLSAFFSHTVATEYSIQIPADFELSDEENTQLDEYLAQRLKGNFTMAGIRFWQDMQSISSELKQKAEAHRQIVVVFTNVVFDTSQTYANLVFESMFDWLEATLTLAAEHPNMLFVVRAHPDELRQDKESQEPVSEWLAAKGFDTLKNLTFIAPTEYVSSYELIDLSQFCIVYNSTIGLEATLLGKPVIAAGQTRYDRENMTHKVASPEAYLDLVQQFLQSGVPPVPAEWQQRARRFMYYSLFKTSLDLSPFTDQAYLYNYTLKPFGAEALHPDRSTVIKTICSGIMNDAPFTVR
jgi:hypothetical protein